MALDLTYRNDEFELDGALICADIELTLTVEIIDFYGIKNDPAFTLEDAVVWHGPTIRPAWLMPLMTAWVAANQPKLAQVHADRANYCDETFNFPRPHAAE